MLASVMLLSRKETTKRIYKNETILGMHIHVVLEAELYLFKVVFSENNKL